MGDRLPRTLVPPAPLPAPLCSSAAVASHLCLPVAPLSEGPSVTSAPSPSPVLSAATPQVCVQVGYLCCLCLYVPFPPSLCLCRFCLPLLPSVSLLLSLIFPHSSLRESLSLHPAPTHPAFFCLPPPSPSLVSISLKSPHLSQVSLARIPLPRPLPSYCYFSHFSSPLCSRGSLSLSLPLSLLLPAPPSTFP